MEIFISLVLIFFSITVFIYNIIPEKSKELILLKRLKKKSSEIKLKKKEPVKKYLNNIINYIELKTKKWNLKFINVHKDDLFYKLQRADLIEKLTPDRFFAIQITSMIGGVIFYLLFLVFLLEVMEFNLLYTLLFMIIGYYFPILWLNDVLKKRQMNILKALPDTIDLLTLCIEAGLDFGAGIREIVEKGREGPLRDEFARLEKEINMGASRIEALRNMAKRNDIDDLNSFLIALIQAIKMGTRLGPILRAQAEQIRIKRSLRAEKMAGEAPVKMLAPLIICIFPTVFIIIFTPIIMQYLIKGW